MINSAVRGNEDGRHGGEDGRCGNGISESLKILSNSLPKPAISKSGWWKADIVNKMSLK